MFLNMVSNTKPVLLRGSNYKRSRSVKTKLCRNKKSLRVFNTKSSPSNSKSKLDQDINHQKANQTIICSTPIKILLNINLILLLPSPLKHILLMANIKLLNLRFRRTFLKHRFSMASIRHHSLKFRRINLQLMLEMASNRLLKFRLRRTTCHNSNE